jgi:hypothetical protein
MAGAGYSLRAVADKDRIPGASAAVTSAEIVAATDGAAATTALEPDGVTRTPALRYYAVVGVCP